MPTTFLRGLALLEIVAAHGPVGISELARALGTDKGGVSRTVAAAVDEGWLRRTADGVVLGPRISVLAYRSELAAELRELQPVVDAVAGVTGLLAQVYVGVGTRAACVVTGGRAPAGVPNPPGFEVSLWSVAAGRALATLVDPGRLAELVPDGPLTTGPDVLDLVDQVDVDAAAGGTPRSSGPPATRAEFLAAVEQVRATGVAYDHGDLHPLIHCIAVPCPVLGEPAAVAVLGTPADVARERELAEAVLHAAVLPGATRESIVRRAAQGPGGS